MSTALTSRNETLPPTTAEALEKILTIESEVMKFEQIEIPTEHVLHGGMYARTVRLPRGSVIVGTLIKIPTMLIVNGEANVLAGEKWHHIEGFQVIAASAWRKQIFIAISPVEITMIFPTEAKTVEEAEEDFTFETEKLLSRRQDNNTVIVTGEDSCQV